MESMPLPYSSDPDAAHPTRGGVRAGSFAALGALFGLGAIVSSSCCVLPLALAVAGLGGAWTGEIAALAPAKPYFLAAGGVALAGGWAIYRRRRARACATPQGGAPEPARRWVPALLSIATLLFAIAAAWSRIEPGLLGWLMERQS